MKTKLTTLIINVGLMLAASVTAQTFTTLHNFTGGTGGAGPGGGVILSGNILYGTAGSGGRWGGGTVFAVNTNGTGFTNLYNFNASSDGAGPNGVVLSGSILYGTTGVGGANGLGTIFAVNNNGTGFTNMHNFAGGSTGANPLAGLIVSGNTLYGTCSTGSTNATFGGNVGTVFAINTTGTDFTTLTSGNGLFDPWCVLTLSSNTLYGTASTGGDLTWGTVFAVNTNGMGFTNLYSFSGRDGSGPVAGLNLSGNTLYGTTTEGGTWGSGTVFAVNTDGTGFRTIYNFTATSTPNPYNGGSNSDGALPYGGVILSGNSLYGTARYGGSSGNGTVFGVNTDGTDFRNVYNFKAVSTGGANPQAGLILSGTTLFGTTTTGGSGTAFSIALPGPPSVEIQPTNSSITIPLGSNVALAVSVSGTGPFSYQWQLNGTNLPNDIITTVAGNGAFDYSGDGGAATNAALWGPEGVAVDATGNLFIADTDNNRIRKVGTNGIISTVAGNGLYTYGDGGAATNAGLSADGVTVDATGNLFIADTYNNRIRKVGADGIIATVAGNGYVNPSNGYGGGYSGDGGAATNAELNLPQGVAVDATGNLFIADTVNNRIREVGTNGIINTVAGNGYVNPYTGSGGYSGDGGAATNAELNGPIDVAVDATGNLFIADTYNNRIRKVGANGIIATVAGNGLYTYGDGGAATNAELYWPFGVAVDATGNVFIADTYNNVIREVGTNGTITTVAGGGTNSLGDGDAAINAELNQPTGVAVDATGNLFIADYFNARIRKVAFDPSVLTPILMLNAVGFENTGVYRVVVSNPYGSTTSSVVTLTVTLPVVLSAPQVIGKTNFTFLLSVPAGSNYVVQASTNLSYWSNVSTSTMPVIGSITLTNAISGYNRRFYRAYLK